MKAKETKATEEESISEGNGKVVYMLGNDAIALGLLTGMTRELVTDAWKVNLSVEAYPPGLNKILRFVCRQDVNVRVWLSGGMPKFDPDAEQVTLLELFEANMKEAEEPEPVA